MNTELKLNIQIRSQDIAKLNENHRFYLWSSLVKLLPKEQIFQFNSDFGAFFFPPDVDGLPSKGKQK